jgi:predicted 3'-5' exonuclease similar to PolB exonuclease domain
MRRNCRGDVIDTYLRFLRARLMRGRIDQGAYRFACEASSHFLADGTALPGVKAPAVG